MTNPEVIGIFILSSIGKRENSAKVAAIAPKKAIVGSIKKRAKINVLTKQAKLPSRLLLVPNSFLLPNEIPMIAAKVSPIDRKHKDRKAISSGKTAIQRVAETIKYVAPVKSWISCLRSMIPNIL